MVRKGNRRRLVLTFVLSAVLGSAAGSSAMGEDLKLYRGQIGHADYCAKAAIAEDEHSVDSNATTYNWLAHGYDGETIDDGFVIALEKFWREDIEASGAPEDSYLREFSPTLTDGKKIAMVRNKWLRRAFDDPKPQIVTHIYEFEQQKSGVIKSCALFSTYPASERQMCEFGGIANRVSSRNFTNGMRAIENKFASRLKSRLSSGRYTHVMLMAMGWHNDQRVSICRIDKIISNTKLEMQRMGRRFKPLIIGLTWPSVWFSGSRFETMRKIGHISSIFNKATDSDEVGYLHGNILLNRIIPQANTGNIPVVAIGHSLGTRIVGRSVFSREILKAPVVGNGPDLAILLQPALSMYRFAPGEGREGHPFAPVREIKTKIVVTTSRWDSANPWAIWTRYIGNGRNLPRIAKLDGTFLVHKRLSDPANPPRDKNGATVSVIDGQEFILDHNDIMSKDMGKLIAGLIRNYAALNN